MLEYIQSRQSYNYIKQFCKRVIFLSIIQTQTRFNEKLLSMYNFLVYTIMQVILQNQESSLDKDWRLLKDTPGFLTLPCFYRLRFFFPFYLDADLEKIQVDPINRKLFYADTGNNLIGSINLDGTGYRVVVNQSLDEPRDLALVPATQ